MTGQTAEGVASCGPVLELARRHAVEMPITEVVEAVTRDGLPIEEAAAMLASRSAKPEWYGPRPGGTGGGQPPVTGGSWGVVPPGLAGR